ncbi:hypothetical protein [Solihabitans fulvus]|uniref:hypothetical protein n=1 Tax=Solihabitans fulvus TaxID=1892852 RepID=UPI0016621655|nr:hypothetical protein [Solihabitans fulvus]
MEVAAVAVIPDRAADYRPVLLLDVAAVVAVARSGPGEGDLLVLAVVEQVVVDELGAVVGVDAQDREREPRGDVLERGQDPLLGLVADGADLGSSRWRCR